MPKHERHKTGYKGVYYIWGTQAGTGKPEKIFYIAYRKDGKQVHEKAGRQKKDDMTAARASKIRVKRMSQGGQTNKERRAAEKAMREVENSRWTIDKLWDEYKANRTPGKSLKTDEGRYEKYLKDEFGSKVPSEIVALDVDRLRLKLSKKLAPQTVKHTLNLFTWIVNFGVKKNLCQGLPFHIQKPRVNNLRTEDLTDEQLGRLLKAIEASNNIQIKNLMKLALYTGMRRGELLKLQWSHIDFEHGHIHIKDPKGGPDQIIPMNDPARQILENHPKSKSPYVFPGKNGRQRISVQSSVNKIKKKAGLPKGFRPLHGLRHTFASRLASSGEVDLYTIQRLLTHKDPRMTQRYAHLRDEALKKVSGVAGDLIDAGKKEDEKDAKIVSLDTKKK